MLVKTYICCSKSPNMMTHPYPILYLEGPDMHPLAFFKSPSKVKISDMGEELEILVK